MHLTVQVYLEYTHCHVLEDCRFQITQTLLNSMKPKPHPQTLAYMYDCAHTQASAHVLHTCILIPVHDTTTLSLTTNISIARTQ